MFVPRREMRLRVAQDAAHFPRMARVNHQRPLAPKFQRLAARLGIPRDYATTRGLAFHAEARRLRLVGRAPDNGKPIRLTPRAAAAWQKMRAAAALDGVTLLPLSGFRSVARQTAIIRRKLRAGQSIAAILRYVAAPGFSEHHSGRAIDIGDPADTSVEESFARTPAYRWLRRHAGEFGFTMTYPRGNRHGIGYEPWHWCWRGKAEGLNTEC
ncbi:MAG: D-alanyl-D-alanine carboxypeptidase [Verrucomicrobiota bacterium]|jgi:D-alanyl-D-alanine carboxypeptidase